MKSSDSRVGSLLFVMHRVARGSQRASFVLLALGLVVVVVAFANRHRDDSKLIPLAAYKSELESDREAINVLRARGFDLSQAFEVDFYLYVPSETSAREACEHVQVEFTCGIREPLDDPSLPHDAYYGKWLSFASAHHVLDVQYLQHAKKIFDAQARTLHGIYDGWEINTAPRSVRDSPGMPRA